MTSQKQRIKAIDYLRMGTAPEAHESTLRSMLKLAKNSHFTRGYRKSPESLLIERLLRLRFLIQEGASDFLIEKEKSLVTLAVANIVGAPSEGFSLPEFVPSPRPPLSEEEAERGLQQLVEQLKAEGAVDEEGYFTEDPN